MPPKRSRKKLPLPKLPGDDNSQEMDKSTHEVVVQVDVHREDTNNPSVSRDPSPQVECVTPGTPPRDTAIEEPQESPKSAKKKKGLFPTCLAMNKRRT
jgi:hypothetical protein